MRWITVAGARGSRGETAAFGRDRTATNYLSNVFS
jgi:hypothetical protein